MESRRGQAKPSKAFLPNIYKAPGGPSKCRLSSESTERGGALRTQWVPDRSNHVSGWNVFQQPIIFLLFAPHTWVTLPPGSPKTTGREQTLTWGILVEAHALSATQMGLFPPHKVESAVDTVTQVWQQGKPDVCRMVLPKAESQGWKDHRSFFLDNSSTLIQELQPTACGAALSSRQANLKQPLNKQTVVLPVGWYITIYLT